MALLLSNEILNAISEELKKATESVQIISAFSKESTIKYLNKYIEPIVADKRILIRFRLDDLLSGSTDFSVIDYCRENGWNVYIRFDLHAKTYIVDNKRGINTSANATSSGLSIGRTGNVELGTLVDIEAKDIEKIDKLFNDAIPVDDPLLEELRNQFEQAKTHNSSGVKSQRWTADILNMFKPNIETLFSYELPDVSTLENGTHLDFLDMDVDSDNINELKETFRWSNSYLWLLKTLNDNGGEMYFGAISKALHDSVVSDPKPYRKDIKDMLSNLLELIEKFGMDEVMIDVPNYSQRVRLRENI
ncbi:MAG: hypothetical protein K6B68_12880 [Eubacterium sp.]|nr:hypothetical protein [Eubacterium sp.]